MGKLSKGFPKVTGRFVREMLYGIQASQSVVLTKVGRMLEESVSIKKVEERLSRQLMQRGLSTTIELSELAKHDAAGLCCSLFCSSGIGDGIKAEGNGRICIKAAKRVFGIPEFHYYAIADGLISIFMRYPGRIVLPAEAAPKTTLFPSST